MMKLEFEEHCGHITSEDFEIVCTVYSYYPGIKNKEMVYELYQKYGMIIFYDMYNRAKKLMDLEIKLWEIQKRKEDLQSGWI